MAAQARPKPKIDIAIFFQVGSQAPPATVRNCSADISSDDSATDFKYSPALKGVPALSDNLARLSAVDLAVSAIQTRTIGDLTYIPKIEEVCTEDHKVRKETEFLGDLCGLLRQPFLFQRSAFGAEDLIFGF